MLFGAGKLCFTEHPMHSLKRKDLRAAAFMLLPFMIFFVLFVLYPLGVNLYYSFTDYNMNTAAWVGLRNFARLPRDTAFVKACRNTLVYAFVSVFALTALGLLTAVLLNRGTRAIKGLRLLFLYPYATSMTAISMIWLMVFDPNHGFLNKLLRFMSMSGANWLFDENLALGCLIFVNVWKNLGYCMLIYLAGINSIPQELYEAATVDGAGEARRLFSITIPMIRPVMFFVFITTMVDGFKTFEQVQIMTRGDPLNATTTIVHQIYLNGFNDFRMGYASAMAVVLLAVVLVLTLINYRVNSLSEREVYGR